MNGDQAQVRRSAIMVGLGILNLAASQEQGGPEADKSYPVVRALMDDLGLKQINIPSDVNSSMVTLSEICMMLDARGMTLAAKSVRFGVLLGVFDESMATPKNLTAVKSLAAEVGIRPEAIDRLILRRRSIRQGDQASILAEEVDKMLNETRASDGPRIFISHSSEDVETAALLVELLRLALRLPASDIRCTSVVGYGLPVGVSIESVLRDEVGSAKVFIGLLSRRGLSSLYVLFELGARWGSGRSILPVLLQDISITDLQGPLANIHAVKLSDAATCHQLVNEVGRILEITPEPPESLLRHVARLATS